MQRVGIPRGLYFYRFYPMWKVFFEQLGCKVIVSSETSKSIMDEGLRSCIDEACLAVKIYFGHVIDLKDKVDYLFIPRLTSISKKEYVCPKIGGLPDMIRCCIKGLPPIIDTEVNMRKSAEICLSSAIQAGAYFTEDISLIVKAYGKAVKRLREYEIELKSGNLPIVETNKAKSNNTSEKPLNIAVIGHCYNLYDCYASMNLLEKIKFQGADITTIEMLDKALLKEKAAIIPKKMFWDFGSNAVGSVLYLLEKDEVDGILYVMTFGCGVDSFVCDYVERLVRRIKGLPFAVIVLDEHSGEAGLQTRVEAFTDMIRWRKENETNISSSGQYVYTGKNLS